MLHPFEGPSSLKAHRVKRYHDLNSWWLWKTITLPAYVCLQWRTLYWTLIPGRGQLWEGLLRIAHDRRLKVGQPWLRNTWHANKDEHCIVSGGISSHCVEQMMAATGVLEPGCYNLTSIWRVQPKFFMAYSSISTKKKQPCWIQQSLLRWSHNITIISCHLPWWNLIKSGRPRWLKSFAMLRSPGMPPTANIETWLRDVEATEGLFRVIQIEWLGKPWDVDGLKANKKRTQVKFAERLQVEGVEDACGKLQVFYVRFEFCTILSCSSTSFESGSMMPFMSLWFELLEVHKQPTTS